MAEHQSPGFEFNGHPLTPEQRQWLLQQLSEEQAVALLQEMREKGGLELKDFIQELEEATTEP
jgi:hypothetical protein